MDSREQKKSVGTEKGVRLRRIRELAVSLYMLALFVAVPLLLRNKYRMLGSFKYEVFRLVSLMGLGLVFMTEVSVWAVSRYQRRKGIGTGVDCPETVSEKGWMQRLVKRFDLTDWFVAGYGLCVIFSYLLAVDRTEAFLGAKGWYMGLVSQLIFVASYFVVSRLWNGRMFVWYAACGTAFVIFLFGVLHRFSLDPFGLYQGLSEEIIRQYLSLIGQNTWYSSYMCTLFPLGLFLFWGGGLSKWAGAGREQERSQKRELIERLAGAVFGVVGFASWVTQNSDSAYIALGLLLLVLFCYGFTGNIWMERFFEVVLLMLFSFSMVGFLQDFFPDRAVLPEALSLLFSRSILPVVLFLLVCIGYGALILLERKGFQIGSCAWIGKGTVALAVVAVIGSILFIVLNTGGYLEEWFGMVSHHNYLLFDDNWGNGRGRTWNYSVRVIRELPILRKLFGVGPDCFAAYGYGDPVYSMQLMQMWGDNRLTNAHCEWMNQVICYGFVGAACYVGIFLSGVVRFLKLGRRKPILIAAALSLLAYAGHNMFCYQQAVCTPFVFIILGMGERLMRLEEK
ncbi:MAG: O-antigen ligase family protein [Lachnospiraceae bacterium]|nr:O-antigen ligase family protein [Lachnospiraceae bacterium]